MITVVYKNKRGQQCVRSFTSMAMVKNFIMDLKGHGLQLVRVEGANK